MKAEHLWKVLPFQAFRKNIDREDIRPVNWMNFDDFLTNGSNGVSVALVGEGDAVGEIKSGNVIVFDIELPPVAGDYVITEDLEIQEYAGDAVLGVITCIISPQNSHRRQRT